MNTPTPPAPLAPTYPPYFEEEWYLRRNPDVAEAVKNGEFESGLDHFRQYGSAEGRAPVSWLDPSYYYDSYPDVATPPPHMGLTPDPMPAYEHFVIFGIDEGRVPSQVFDYEFYLEKNDDVREAVERGETTEVRHQTDFSTISAMPGSMKSMS